MNPTIDQLVADYRTRLRAASSDLPVEVRDDLLDDVEAHLADIRATSRDADDATAALARLGAPEEVAAAARTEAGDAPTAPPSPFVGATGPPSPVAGVRPDDWAAPPAPVRTGPRPLDVVTVSLLLLGGVLGGVVLGPIGALVAWVLGVLLLWSSSTWSIGQKLLGTLVVPGGLATPLLVLLLPAQACSTIEEHDPTTGETILVDEVCEGFAFAPWLGIIVLVATVVGPIIVSAYLLRRARR